MSKQFLGEIKWVKETREQRLVDFLESDAKLTPGSKQFLGEVSWLGAAPSLIKKWFPERTDAEWDNLDQADQNTLLMQANSVEAQWNGKIAEMRYDGACDATKPGLLAGAMREYLIKSGGKLENMDDLGGKSFGPKDCAEWWAVFGKAPDQETVAKGIGLVTGSTSVWVKNSANGYTRQITLNMVCPSGFKLPSCPAPGGGSPGGGGGGGPECSPTKPCLPGYECCQQGWTAGEFGEATPGCTPGKCVQKCPSGYTRGADGVCKAVSTGGGSSSSGPGLLILGAAALGLAFVASKSQLEKIPQRQAGRLLENKKRRRRY